MLDCNLQRRLQLVLIFFFVILGGTQAFGESAVGLISEGPRRIVIGSHLIVEESEILDEVVVIAGSADIKGNVGKLIVVAGEVHLWPTAIVREELNTVGGLVRTDPGAQMQGQNIKVGVPLSEESWRLIFDKLKNTGWGKWLRQDSTKFMFSIFKIFSLMIFAFLGFYMAPEYQRHVKTYFKKHFPSCLLWGGVSLLLVLPITMFLALSVVGIPLMPLQFSIYFLFFVYGYIHGARLLAGSAARFYKPIKKWPNLVLIFLGLIALEGLSFLPYLGAFLKWLVVFAGFGAASKVFYHQALMPKGKRFV